MFIGNSNSPKSVARKNEDSLENPKINRQNTAISTKFQLVGKEDIKSASRPTKLHSQHVKRGRANNKEATPMCRRNPLQQHKIKFVSSQ